MRRIFLKTLIAIFAPIVIAVGIVVVWAATTTTVGSDVTTDGEITAANLTAAGDLSVWRLFVGNSGHAVYRTLAYYNSLNFGVIPAYGCVDRALTVTGAATDGDPGIVVSPGYDLGTASSTIVYSAWIPDAGGEVIVRACQNASSTTSSLMIGDVYVTVFDTAFVNYE